MGKKKTLFKGIMRGTAKSFWTSNFVIELDDKIEGLPEEFVVYSAKFGTPSPGAGFGMMKSMAKIISTNIRPGDKVIVDGELIVEYEGKEDLEFIRMGADHIYNETLKCGF